MSEIDEKLVNERISSYFEPPPAIVNQIDTEPRPVRSKNGAWHIGWSFVSIHRMMNFVTPLDYFLSEDANSRLLEAMAVLQKHGESVRLYEERGWWHVSLRYLAPTIDKDRKTAIVLAFCKFANINIEGLL